MRCVRRLLFALFALAIANALAVPCLAPRYETLPSGARIGLAGHHETLESIAIKYVPAFYEDPAMPAGPLREVLYEAREREGRLSILYRTIWQDEIHPVRAADFLYRLFRRVYFGTAIDVEYVLVEIDLETGEILALDYQTEPSLAPDEFFSAHRRVREIGPRPPIELRVVTWNHMLARLDKESAPRGLVRSRPPVRAARDADRRELWLARATYGYLEDFGPLTLGRQAPLFAAALLAALALERLIARRRTAT